MVRNFVFILNALMLPCLAAANCPAADKLVEIYGISFSGFERPIPKTQVEPKFEVKREDIARVVLRGKSNVADGFEHTAVINKTTKQAWVLRTGGFVGVYEWYGPVKIDNVELQGCVVNTTPLTQK